MVLFGLNIFLLIYLVLITAFLSFVFSYLLKKRGPWENPGLLFLVVFMTTWTLAAWLEPVQIDHISYPYLSVTGMAILITILVASSGQSKTEPEKVRKIKDKKVVNVLTKPVKERTGMMPGVYFWVLLTLESLLIITAYVFKI